MGVYRDHYMLKFIVFMVIVTELRDVDQFSELENCVMC